MGFGEVWWARRPDVPEAPLQPLDRLSPYDLRLTHPDTGGVRRLTDDGVAETVLDAFPHLRTFTVALWVDADTDVLTSVSAHGDVTLTEFDLDGLTAAEARRVVDAVVRVATADPASIGLVVDSRLPDTATAWERFLLGDGPGPSHAPAFLWRSETGSDHVGGDL